MFTVLNFDYFLWTISTFLQKKVCPPVTPLWIPPGVGYACHQPHVSTVETRSRDYPRPEGIQRGVTGGRLFFLISKNRSQIFRKWYSAWITSWLDHRGHKKSWEPTMGNLIRPSKNRSDNLQKLWPRIPNNEITQNYDFSTGEHLKITPDTCKDFWNIFARRTQGVSITPRHARARKFY